MAQRTTEYVFTDFQAEIAALIIRYCSSILHEKYNALKRNYEGIQIEHVQEGAFNQLRQSAIDLRNFLRDGNYNVSEGCIAFLQDMIDGAPELDHPKSHDQLPHQDGSSKLVGGSKTTTMYSTKPEADHQRQMSVTQNQGSEQRLKEENARLIKNNERTTELEAQLRNTKNSYDAYKNETIEREDYMKIQLKEENARLIKNNKRTTELEAKLRNTRNSYDAYKNETIEREDYMKIQYEVMQKKMMTELENTKSNFAKKLREARDEADQWKTQLEMMAEDNVKQKQRLSEEVHRLHRENRQLIKSRVSESAGAKLMDNNLAIDYVSDPNRAMKIGERFSSLFDDDWTDGYEMFTEKFKLSEEAAIRLLLEILLKIYEFCKRVADEQMDCLCNIFEHPCTDIPLALTMRPQNEKVQMTQKQHKELKDLRKQIALSKVNNITKQYMNKEAEEVKQRGNKQEKSMFEMTRDYHQKCVEVCWPMVLHDPPVHMDQTVKPGVKIDGNRFRLYGGKGDILEYLVWPCLLVQGGGLIARGVAKPTKSAKGVTKKQSSENDLFQTNF